MASPWSGGYRVRILGKLHGQDCINVLHFGTNTDINDAATQDALILALLTALLLCVTDQLLPGVTSDYTCTGAEATRIYPSFGDPVFKAAPADSHGTLGPTSASFIASLVNIRTGLGGRTHRGRFFLPPAGEANTNNSLLDGPTFTQLTAFVTCVANKFIGAAATTDFRVGVLSRKLMNHDPSNWNNSFTEATQLLPSNVAAIMGSRKVNRGS